MWLLALKMCASPCRKNCHWHVEQCSKCVGALAMDLCASDMEGNGARTPCHTAPGLDRRLRVHPAEHQSLKGPLARIECNLHAGDRLARLARLCEWAGSVRRWENGLRWERELGCVYRAPVQLLHGL